MKEYKVFLDQNKIPYMEYDWERDDFFTLLEEEERRKREREWWLPYFRNGSYPVGCLNKPELYILAESLGPSNVHNIPWEAGPTGILLSEMIGFLQIPLGTLALSNLIKENYTVQRKKPNKRDMELLQEELSHIQPQRAVLMGLVAKEARELFSCPTREIPHLGYLHRRLSGPGDKISYFLRFKSLFEEPQEEEAHVRIL